MEEPTRWRDLTGDVGDPEKYGKADLDRLLRKLFDAVRIPGAGQKNSERKLAIQELWEESGGSPAAIVWAVNKALTKEKGSPQVRGINYIKSLLPSFPNGSKTVAEQSAALVNKEGPKEPEGRPSASPPPAPSPIKAAPKPKEAPKPTLAYSRPEPARVDNSLRWKAELSKIKFAPTLTLAHKEDLKKRCISPEFAMASGARTMIDGDARDLSFDASISTDQRKRGLNGISFAYCDPETRDERSYRLKPDAKFDIQGSPAKYINRRGDPLRIYFPHTTTTEMLQDSSISMIITEGEFKTLSIAENLQKANPTKQYAVIGLSGVNGGWQRGKHTTYKSDGSKEEKSHGNPHLIEDFDLIKFNNRTVYIIFDSDVGRKKHAELFKKSKYQGAIGAEHILTTLLRAKGAEVRIVQLPDEHETEKTGADDFIAEHGAGELIKVMHTRWVAHRDIESILHVKVSTALVFKTAQELVDSAPAKPDFAVNGLLPNGGTMIVAGAPKVGKSSVLLNLAWAVATGEKFLGEFQTTKGNVLYVQTEIPEWAMAERLKSFPDLPPGLIVCTPEKFTLNFYEEDNFRKTPTGNNERVGALVAKMKEFSISLLMLDPLNHFHSMDENKRSDMTHVYEVIRMINRSAGCATVIAHHNRKTGGRQGHYQGAEDMIGSQSHFAEPDCVLSMYKERRKDETYRMKLLFETRHCEQINPRELVRNEADNSLLWYSEEWKESDKVTLEHGRAVLETLKNGPGKAKDLIDRTGLSRRTFFRAVKALEDDNLIEKSGHMYCLTANERNAGPAYEND